MAPLGGIEASCSTSAVKLRNAECETRNHPASRKIICKRIIAERGRRGTASVEMALVLPLLLMFIFGIIEYGWMFTKAHQIRNAARHGARIAILPDSQWGDVQNAVATLMGKASITNYDLPPVDLSSIATGGMVTVNLSVNYSDIKLTGITLIPTPTKLGASVTMAKEGP